MMKIVTIIGARPQIIKAAALSRAIRSRFPDKLSEVIVHTGQHYDDNMSKVFFEEMEIPQPHYNLNVGSDSHARQTAAMMTGIEEILMKEKPACIVLYGDTNSTLAGAVAASKIHVPVVHIEAGLRSFNKSMPEEINRIVCDHVSTLLFSPTKAGFANLVKEGFSKNTRPPFTSHNPKIYHCGDVMYDNSLHFAQVAEEKTTILHDHQLENNSFVLATIHRNTNTDDPKRLGALFSAMNRIAKEENITFVIPLHPRTSKLLPQNLRPELYSSVKTNPLMKIIEPVSFLEMIALEKNCRLVMTDSGGVQKESFFFKKTCVILRPETEWVELVKCGTALIADANEKKIIASYKTLSHKKKLKFPSLFGDGKAAEFICGELLKYFSN